MKKMGKYCKAYYLSKLRQYSGWTEHRENARPKKEQVDGKEVEVQRELTDEDILYLQEDFTVTDGIFMEENVIFDAVTPEWLAFCKETLAFELPADETLSNGGAAG